MTFRRQHQQRTRTRCAVRRQRSGNFCTRPAGLRRRYSGSRCSLRSKSTGRASNSAGPSRSASSARTGWQCRDCSRERSMHDRDPDASALPRCADRTISSLLEPYWLRLPGVRAFRRPSRFRVAHSARQRMTQDAPGHLGRTAAAASRCCSAGHIARRCRARSAAISDITVAPARSGNDVMFDLVAQVARHEMQPFAARQVGRAAQLAQIPVAARFIDHRRSSGTSRHAAVKWPQKMIV